MEAGDWRKPASSFLSQAIAGVWMARRRFSEDAELANLTPPAKEFLLAHYLNGVWRSLITRDDKVVTDYWDAIHKAMPDESPQCLMHKLFTMGCMLLEEPINVECDDIEKLRLRIHRVCERRCDEAFALVFNEPHTCQGPTYESLQSLPIDDQFFRFREPPPDIAPAS